MDWLPWRWCANNPDVVPKDLVMPLLDGYKATRQIRAHNPASWGIALIVHEYEAAWHKALQDG